MMMMLAEVPVRDAVPHIVETEFNESDIDTTGAAENDDTEGEVIDAVAAVAQWVRASNIFRQI